MINTKFHFKRNETSKKSRNEFGAGAFSGVDLFLLFHYATSMVNITTTLKRILVSFFVFIVLMNPGTKSLTNKTSFWYSTLIFKLLKSNNTSMEQFCAERFYRLTEDVKAVVYSFCFCFEMFC